MTLIVGIDPEELRVREGQYPALEDPLEAAWSFWYDKKTSDRKESDQYMEGLKQLGSFNTIQGFYRHYTYLLRPSELPRDQNLLLFRKGYKPMWEEFPEGGCWIIRIKRKVSQSYVNRMWENLLLACIGEEFEMPDVVGCVLSTRLKDDVLSIWNISNRDTPARFRIGEKLKEILDLDMNALIQYKDHMQSLQDYSTYRNAKNYMFAPSPTVTPMQSTLETPLVTMQEDPIGGLGDVDFMVTGLEDEDFDEMLPPAAVDTGGFGAEPSWSGVAEEPSSSMTQARASPKMSAAASPWLPNNEAPALRSPAMSAAAAPWSPAMSATASPMFPSKSAGLSADAEVFKPKDSTAAETATSAPMSSAPVAEPTIEVEPTAAASAAAGAEAATVGEGRADAGVFHDAASSPLEAAAAAVPERDPLAGAWDDPASVAAAGATATSGALASAGEAEAATSDTVDTAMFPSLGTDRTPTRPSAEGPSRSWASVVASKSAGNGGAGASGSPTARQGAGPKARATPGGGALT